MEPLEDMRVDVKKGICINGLTYCIIGIFYDIEGISWQLWLHIVFYEFNIFYMLV